MREAWIFASCQVTGAIAGLTAKPTATATITSTRTPKPQPLLLRRACGRDYAVRANEAIELFYGGWGVKGFDLAQQWASALIIDLTVDELPVEGRQQPITSALPMNCRSDPEGTYWLFYKAIIPELTPGTHHVTVTFNALRALSDGSVFYGPGRIAQQTFRIMAQ